MQSRSVGMMEGGPPAKRARTEADLLPASSFLQHHGYEENFFNFMISNCTLSCCFVHKPRPGRTFFEGDAKTSELSNLYPMLFMKW